MKKLFSILAGLALSMALLTSCEKNPETDSNNGISDAGAVTGVLKDAETGETMANKYVRLFGDSYLGLMSQTDAEGRFLFGHIPPSLDYYIYRIFDEENYYDVVYLSVDGEVRDLYTDIDTETGYLKDKHQYFSVKAGQVRELELRVVKHEEY